MGVPAVWLCRAHGIVRGGAQSQGKVEAAETGRSSALSDVEKRCSGHRSQH